MIIVVVFVFENLRRFLVFWNLFRIATKGNMRTAKRQHSSFLIARYL